MPDNDDDTHDPTIEPTLRQIARLGPAIGERRHRSLGVLPPFAGLLRTGGPGAVGERGGGTQLSYLTLEPLVVAHLRERTVTERTVERVQSDDRSIDGDRTAGPDDGDDGTSMTVRELVRQVGSTEAEDRPDRPGSDPRGRPDSTEFRTLGQGNRDDSPASAGGDDPASLLTADPEFGRSRSAGAAGDAAPNPTTRGDPPPLTLDTPETGGRDDDAIGMGRGRSSEMPTGMPGSDRGRTGDDGGPSASGETDLVLARRPPTAPVEGGERATSEAPPGQSGSPIDSAVGPGDGGPGPGRQSTRPATSPGPGSDDRAETELGPQTRSETSRSTAEAVPLSLDRLDRPALDRFVEQLSDELSRHERIERERRGR